MNDINFLKEYSVKTSKVNSRYILLIASIIILCVSIMKSFDNHNKINQLSLEIELLEINRQNEILNMELDTENNLDIAKTEIEERYNRIVDFDDFMKSNYIIDEVLLMKIVDTIPSDLFLESIYMDQNIVSLTGSSTDKLLIAEFQNNLKSIISIKNVFVDSIYKDDNQEKFSLNIYLRGIENDRSEE